MTGKLGGGLRRTLSGIAGAAIVAGMTAGTAGADPSPVPTPVPRPTVALEGGAAPANPTTTATATAATAGDVLDVLAEEYAIGSGGGTLSNLLRASLKLRAMGFKPSKPYLDELTKAMTYRPNQGPLIAAMKNTIAYQQKIRAQTQVLQQAQAQQAQAQQGANSAVMGGGQMPGSNSAPAAVAPAPPPATP